MFHNWGFLLMEIWLLLILAALVGLLAGWIIWGRRKAVTVVDDSETRRLNDALASCTTKGDDLSARLAAAETRTKEAEARAISAEAKARAAADASKAADMVGKAAAASAAPAPMAALAAKAATIPAPALALTPAPTDAVIAQTKPATLTAARNGKPDDLKLIKGIGPKLEVLCNKLGFYHFDQIAAWTDAEIAWVDENLEGFKGRVVRDEWVAQAKNLA